MSSNHLSRVQRPLLKVHNIDQIRINEKNYPIKKIKLKAYSNSPLGKGRKYYYGEGFIVKEYPLNELIAAIKYCKN